VDYIDIDLPDLAHVMGVLRLQNQQPTATVCNSGSASR